MQSASRHIVRWRIWLGRKVTSRESIGRSGRGARVGCDVTEVRQIFGVANENQSHSRCRNGHQVVRSNSSSLTNSPFKTLGVILYLDQDQYQLAPTREAALEARDMQRASMGMAAE
jgi:hypothetical protein